MLSWPQLLSPFLPPHLGFPRDLDARAKNEWYRATFRLPQDERLDGHTGCTLWTPFSKLHIPGQMFISGNYICFASKERDACHLIIPLREVSPRPHISLPHLQACTCVCMHKRTHHTYVHLTFTHMYARS